MLYYGLGIGIFIYLSVKNGYLVLDLRQSVFLFLTLSLVFIQWFLKTKHIHSKFLIFIQVFVLLAYFFPQYFTFLEKINHKNMRRLFRGYNKLRGWTDNKFKEIGDSISKKRFDDDDEITVASTADIDENEIIEMKRILEKKEEKLRKHKKKKKKIKTKMKNNNDDDDDTHFEIQLQKPKYRSRKRKISKKVKFNEDSPSQDEINSMIENIANVFANNK